MNADDLADLERMAQRRRWDKRHQVTSVEDIRLERDLYRAELGDDTDD